MSSPNAGIRGTIGKMGIMCTNAPSKSPNACNMAYAFLQVLARHVLPLY